MDHGVWPATAIPRRKGLDLQMSGLMMVRYRLDPGPSRFTVQAFAAGFLSVFGHSPTFAARRFAGSIDLPAGTSAAGKIELTIQAGSLDVIDKMNIADRMEIEQRLRDDLFEISVFPEIRFEANEVHATRLANERAGLRISGRLELHGVSKCNETEAQLLQYEDGIRILGESKVKLSDFGIRQVTALGGAIKLKDEVRVEFDLIAWKEHVRNENSESSPDLDRVHREHIPG